MTITPQITARGKAIHILSPGDLMQVVESGERLRAFCPIHGGDHQRSLSIDRATGWGFCHCCHGAALRVPRLPSFAWTAPSAHLISGVCHIRPRVFLTGSLPISSVPLSKGRSPTWNTTSRKAKAAPKAAGPTPRLASTPARDAHLLFLHPVTTTANILQTPTSRHSTFISLAWAYIACLPAHRCL